MHKLYLLLITICSAVIANAQQTGRMETDRPDQTESPFITKHKYIQAEIGFNREYNKGIQAFIHPTVLWKYGAVKKFEFRLITELVSVENSLSLSSKKYTSSLLPVQLGGKLSLSEEKGILPKTSVIFHIAAPKIASKKFRATKWAPNFRFTMQNTLSQNIGLGYNVGAEWDGESNTPFWIYTISPGFNIGKKWYAYIEAYGAIAKNQKPEHAIDGGIAYYFSDDTKIDFSGSVGISEEALDNYIAIGFSFRFNTKKKLK